MDDVAENQEGKTLDELAGKGAVVASFNSWCHGIRSEIELAKGSVKELMQHDELNGSPAIGLAMEQVDEMGANLKLAYRHLEDARMRLGKAIQARDGGKSCYKD